jgi:hypothetical protein
VAERSNPDVKWRAANPRSGSSCDNIVSRRNVTLPHAQVLDECFFLAILAGEVTVQSWSTQIEKTKTRRHTLNVQHINMLMGIGAMGSTRRGAENQRTVYPLGHSHAT